jgi:hypothetical protein
LTLRRRPERRIAELAAAGSGLGRAASSPIVDQVYVDGSSPRGALALEPGCWAWAVTAADLACQASPATTRTAAWAWR